MKITIISVGKVKESFYRDAIREFTKRLSSYCKLNIVEVDDEKTPDGASEAVELMIKAKEGEKIIRHLDDRAFKIALTIDGKKFDSVSLSKYLEKLGVSGYGHIQFVIGGSLGLHPEVVQKADLKLSFSDMTFPHQLMRVFLLEQIYRCFRIQNSEPYHK